MALERAVDLLIAGLERTKRGRASRPQKKPRAAKGGYVTRAARREIAQQDGWQCAIVSDDGRRSRGFAFCPLRTPGSGQ